MQKILRLITLLCVGVVICAASNRSLAQDYYFGVPKVQMTVTVNPDASAKIEYDFTFRNTGRGHRIDVVDVGTPHSGYNLNNVRASVDGHTLHDIRDSTYVKGFEVHLGPFAIPPSSTGKVHVEFTMPNMVYQDTTNPELASMRISPTWFGNQYVQGDTHLQIAIQLPKSVKPDEVLHQGHEFSLKAMTDDGTRVGWDFPSVRFTGKNMVALSFPKRDMQKVIKQTAIDLLLIWFEDSPRVRITLGVIFMVLWAVVFFRFSGGTGFTVYIIVAGVCGFVFWKYPGCHLLAMPCIVMLLGLNEWLLARRKSHYMPPIAEIEGGGIKRGLTAPEAAVLLELPIGKVLSLAIFGMLKKGIIRQVKDDPLTVAVNEPFLVKSSTVKHTVFYRQVAVEQGIVIHNYEQPFLFLIQSNPTKPVREIDFSRPVKMLIQSAANRMKGFDLSDTQDYYRSIIRRATEQAAAIGDIQQQEKTINRNFEWILMDDDYGRVFRHRPSYRPIWWYSGSSGSSPVGPSSAPSAGGGNTSFGDVAASFSGWTENTMGGMADAIAPGSLSLPGHEGGFLNLSGVDHVTGEFFSALSSSGGGGGGGGGCACAGCACACACAGGGR